MKPLSIAILGVTGAVGQKFLEVIEERKVPFTKLVLFASARSAGKTIAFKGKNYTVLELTEAAVQQHAFDYVFVSSGNDISAKFSPLFAAKKAIVIDNSSQFRMDPKVPLVVPEVNASDALTHQGIISNPNCSTVQAVVAMKPLHDAFNLKRFVISTYQAVSGAGSEGIADLLDQNPEGKTIKFPHQIHRNLFPHIDDFLDNGNTKEEQKVINESRKIMHLPNLRISATAVRVPVVNGHSESLNLEFEKPFTVEQVKRILKNAPGVTLYDEVAKNQYPMPMLVDGQDNVFVGRIRKDDSVTNGLNLFIAADNLRKGAATNAIQIMEWLRQHAKASL